MKNRINVAELLKGCPKGMKLDCTAYNDVTFLHVDESQNRCYFKTGPADTFWTTCYGHLNHSPNAKCVIFPIGKDTWEGFVPQLVTEKFDINTLVPFESRVLVRDRKCEEWRPAVWGYYDEITGSYPFEVVGGHGYTFCVPYEGNEHLLGTTKDCEDRYKRWLS